MFPRLLIRVVVLLVLGLLMTWSVAWACAWVVPLEGARVANITWPSAGTAQRRRSLGVEQVKYGKANLLRIDGASGWPMLALQWECDIDTTPTVRRGSIMGLPPSNPAPPAPRWHLDPGTAVGRSASATFPNRPDYADAAPIAGLLPLKPIWRGLIVNTLFFAATFSVAMLALRSRVRFARHRRGLCPSCRYLLRGLPEQRCPECGTRTDGIGTRRDRCVARLAALVAVAIFGANSAVAIAWLCALNVDYRAAQVEEGWLTQPPADWLVRRYDAFGSTRVAWLYEDGPEKARVIEQRQRLMIGTKEFAEDARLVDHIQSEWRRRWKKIVDWQNFMYQVRENVAPANLPSGPQFIDDPSRVRSQIIDARGWPFRAMWCAFHTSSNPGYSAAAIDQSGFGVLHGIPIKRPRGQNLHTATALPTKFVWPGFALDALLFAIGWWVILLTTRWVGARLWRLGGRTVRLVRGSKIHHRSAQPSA